MLGFHSALQRGLGHGMPAGDWLILPITQSLWPDLCPAHIQVLDVTPDFPKLWVLSVEQNLVMGVCLIFYILYTLSQPFKIFPLDELRLLLWLCVCKTAQHCQFVVGEYFHIPERNSQEEFLHRKCCWTLEQTAQGDAGIATPGHAQ